MKKKLIWIVSFALMCFPIAISADTVEETEEIIQIPEAYQSYLLNREYFVDWVKYVPTGEYPDSFAFLDLNQDDTEELIIKDDILHIFYEGGGEENYGCYAEIELDTLEASNITYFNPAFDYGYLSSHMKVANCSEYVTLRCVDSVTAEGKTTIPLGAYVQYLAPAQNGFCKVQYSGLEGYVLSEYLIRVE